MAAKRPITPTGYQRLKEQLKRLREVDQPAIIKEVAAAREHGDISENAEYHAAREKHAMIKTEIDKTEDALARAEVIDPSKLSGDKITFGASVRLSNVETGEEVAYTIVGPDEAGLITNGLNVESPIARSLIGREVGDEVKVRIPAGVRTYEVLEVVFR